MDPWLFYDSLEDWSTVHIDFMMDGFEGTAGQSLPRTGGRG